MAYVEGKSAPDVYGLTQHLITKSDGSKFGKTESGAIWLSADRTSPYAFYQYFIQTPDADVLKLLKYFTFLPINEIKSLEDSLKREPEKRTCQITLARELTSLVHGKDEVQKAEAAAKALFGSEIKDLNEKMLLEILGDAPSLKKSKADLNAEPLLIDLFVETGLCKSKGAAKTDFASGAIYLNNERISDMQFKINIKCLIAGSFIVLRKGKKNYFLVSFK